MLYLYGYRVSPKLPLLVCAQLQRQGREELLLSPKDAVGVVIWRGSTGDVQVTFFQA